MTISTRSVMDCYLALIATAPILMVFFRLNRVSLNFFRFNSGPLSRMKLIRHDALNDLKPHLLKAQILLWDRYMTPHDV